MSNTITVTLTFASQDELLAFFAGKTATAGEGVKNKEKAAPAPAATAPAATETVAKPQVNKAEAPKPETAAAPSAQAAPGASTASEDVPYATLQKAVFALAAKSREAAGEVAAALGVANFKGYEQNAEGRPAALAAVNAKLAELGA